MEKENLIELDKFFKQGYTVKDINIYCTQFCAGTPYKVFWEGVKILNRLGAFNYGYKYKQNFDLKENLNRSYIVYLDMSVENFNKFEQICKDRQLTHTEGFNKLLQMYENIDFINKEKTEDFWRKTFDKNSYNKPQSLLECSKNDFKYSADILLPLVNKYYHFDENEKLSGIYGIYNKDQLCYIGRSINCINRFQQHIMNSLSPYWNNSSKKISEYIQKNWQTISFVMLEELPQDIELQKIKERKWIEEEKPFLNTVYVTKYISEGKYI